MSIHRANPARSVVANSANGKPDARRRWRRRAAVIALPIWFLVFTLFSGEVVLRSASRFGIQLFDTEMWRYATQVKRASERPGIVLEHRPNLEATLMGVRIRTDARGFRRAAPELEGLRTGSERIVAVVGDSCALGWGVPEGATVGEQLERMLNAFQTAPDRRIEVVNASVGNSNTAMEYARYVQDVRPLKPVWVILGFFINDAEPDPHPKSSPVLEHSVLLAMMTARLPGLVVPALRDYRSYYERLYTPDGPGLESFRRAMRAFGAAVREDGVEASILLIPEMHEPRHFGEFAHIYKRVAALAQESGFEVIDPSGDFPPGSGVAYFVNGMDSHPNAQAHAVLAAALARSRIARQLVDGG